MTQHIELNHEDIAHDGFFDPIQELLSAAAPYFRIKTNSEKTGIELESVGTGNEQHGIAIGGKYRYRSTNTTAALPGSPSAKCPIFVTATANDFTGPVENPDKTTHTFGLEIKKEGETPSTALYRQVGWAYTSASKITGLEQYVGSVGGAQIREGALSGEGDITWTREASGAWVPQLKSNSVGASEIEANAVGASEIGTLPQCRVRNVAGDISISSSTETYLEYPTEVEDSDTMHSTSSNKGRITCVTPGVYMFWAQLNWIEILSGGTISGWFRRTIKAGGTEKRGRQKYNGGSTTTFTPAMALSCPIRLVAEDYVEVGVWTDDSGGGKIDVEHETFGYGAEFGAIWLSD